MGEVAFFDLGRAARARADVYRAAFDSVLDAGQFVGGDAVSEFERAFGEHLGAVECVSVGNGLDALRIGMEALGIGPGDEVIVPGFTFYATWLAVLQLGARPVPVEVRLDTAGVNVAAIEEALTPRTRAILVVHLFGIPVDLRQVRALADAAGVALVEDAAQSHGAARDGLMTGTVGDVAGFSFYPTKNLGALGDAGAVTARSFDVAATIRSRRSYGQGASKYDHVDTGWNSRLDTLQATFLSLSLPWLEDANDRRRAIATEYLTVLGDRSSSVIGATDSDESVWHHFVIRAADRDLVRQHLAKHGIGTDVHYPYWFGTLAPLSTFSTDVRLPVCTRLAREVVSLPIAPWLTDAEVAQVAGALAVLPAHALAS